MSLRNAWKPARTRILYFALALFVLEQSWFYSTIFPYNAYVEEAVKLVFLLAIALVIALQDFTAKLYLIYGLLAVACVLTRIGSGQMLWTFVVITILAIRQEELTGVLRLIRRCQTGFLIVHTVWFCVLWFQGLRPLFTIDDAGRARATLGFCHPNPLAAYFFNLVMLWVWEKYDSIGAKELACLFAAETAMFALTNTRTAYLCGILLLLLVGLAKHSGKAAAWISCAAKWIAPAAAGFMLVCSAAWLASPGNPILAGINSLLSRRVYLGAYAIRLYGFTLFGQPMTFDTSTSTPEWPIPFYTLDCVYLYCACCVGLLWLILICLSFYQLGKLRDPRISICVISWALYGTSEMITLNVFYFFPLLLISLLLQPGEVLARRYPAMEPPGKPRRLWAGVPSDGGHGTISQKEADA